MDDVWAVVDLIIDETVQVNEDIERYTYCEKFNIPPYEGCYDNQPAKWVRRAFAIRKAFAKKEKKDIDGRKNNN